MSSPISHLDVLESESIHIFREAAAQFRKPVLLYSIGRPTVLLHLARKAFFPQEVVSCSTSIRREVSRHDRFP